MVKDAPAVVHVARNFGETEELVLWERYARARGHFLIELCPGARVRGGDRYTELGGSIAAMRARLRRAQAQLPPRRTHIYHQGGWGLDAVAPADTAERRFAFFHEPLPLFERLVVHVLRFAQGVIVPVEGMKARIRAASPWIPDGRIHVVPHPWTVIADALLRPAPARVPGLTGFPGRVEFRQKRADRLPRFLEAEEFSGELPLEVFPVGNDVRSFRRKWRRDARVVWREERALPDRVGRMRAWDVAVFLSSFEGLPQGLAWCVESGVLPLFPEGGGIEPPFHLSVDCVYEAGETEDAMGKYSALCGLGAEARGQLAECNRRGLAAIPRTDDAMAAMLEAEANRPKQPLPRKAAFGPFWPVRIYGYFIHFARTGQWGGQRFMHEPGRTGAV